VTPLTQEVSALNTQLTKANKDIAELPLLIQVYRSQLQSANSALSNELSALNSEIIVLKSEIDKQVQEVANEASFEKDADNVAKLRVTDDLEIQVDHYITKSVN
jgi:predicted  nucleic acid-binding Zn-ribbon protein